MSNFSRAIKIRKLPSLPKDARNPWHQRYELSVTHRMTVEIAEQILRDAEIDSVRALMLDDAMFTLVESVFGEFRGDFFNIRTAISEVMEARPSSIEYYRGVMKIRTLVDNLQLKMFSITREEESC